MISRKTAKAAKERMLFLMFSSRPLCDIFLPPDNTTAPFFLSPTTRLLYTIAGAFKSYFKVDAQFGSMKILRRILWSLYAWPMTLLLWSSDVFAGFQYHGPYIIPFAVLDFLICFPSIIAMHLHIWDEKLFTPAFWKIYAFVFLAWDLSFNILITPAITGEKFDLPTLVGGISMLPLYVAVFRYAFRKWPAEPTPAIST